MLAGAADKNRRFPHPVLCKSGLGQRETRERFLCVLGQPAAQSMSGSQALSFPALQNEEWRDRGEGREL